MEIEFCHHFITTKQKKMFVLLKRQLYTSLFTIIMVAQKEKNYSQRLKTRAIHSKLNLEGKCS